MYFILKRTSGFHSFLAIVILSMIPHFIFSQSTLTGKVIYQKDDAPAAFANIELLNDPATTMTDWAGNFKINIPNPKRNDSVLISSVGYETIRMPVSAAFTKSVFVLKEIVKNMEPVTVFSSHQVIGSMAESVGYYRSWSHEKTGGEIGCIFQLPHKAYKIDKIRFKAGNLCDTCLLRIHIRRVVDGMPEDEILSDSISMYVNKLSLDTKIPEFDLTPYDLTFKDKEFFVGIEVLNCANGKKGFCSFNFAGTEKGEYFYKSKATTDWQSTDDYTIYLKLFLRY